MEPRGGRNHPNDGLGVVSATPWYPREKAKRKTINKKTNRKILFLYSSISSL
jgi:hypothetical protein